MVLPSRISDPYLSLQNRLAIADGRLSGQSLTRIAAGIGKYTSTVSREIAARSIDGLYLPIAPISRRCQMVCVRGVGS